MSYVIWTSVLRWILSWTRTEILTGLELFISWDFIIGWTWGRVELERNVSHTLGKSWETLTWSLCFLIFKSIDPIRTHDLLSTFFSLLHILAPTNIFFIDIATQILSEFSTYVVEWTWWFMTSSFSLPWIKAVLGFERVSIRFLFYTLIMLWWLFLNSPQTKLCFIGITSSKILFPLFSFKLRAMDPTLR
jgi:hypothetical protein